MLGFFGDGGICSSCWHQTGTGAIDGGAAVAFNEQRRLNSFLRFKKFDESLDGARTAEYVRTRWPSSARKAPSRVIKLRHDNVLYGMPFRLFEPGSEIPSRPTPNFHILSHARPWSEHPLFSFSDRTGCVIFDGSPEHKNYRALFLRDGATHTFPINARPINNFTNHLFGWHDASRRRGPRSIVFPISLSNHACEKTFMADFSFVF